MKNKFFWGICLISIVVGLVYRLILTSNGNFIFNMDNARDMVDIREMVELGKWRLIGPTSGIDGLYTGPGWYYLLSVPYVFSRGDPYASVLLMIVFWAIGGFFVGLVMKERGFVSQLLIWLCWVFSPYLILVTTYALNPNPVVLLSPIIFYSLYKYLKSPRFGYLLVCWIFSGLYFNLEMATGVCLPFIILTVIIWKNGWKRVFAKEVVFGLLIMGIFFVPQLLFEFRHGFFMTRSVLSNISQSQEHALSISRVFGVWDTAYSPVLSGTLFNSRVFVSLWLFLLSVEFYKIYLGKKIDDFLKLILIFLIVPLVIHLVIPIKVMPWHLGFWIIGIIYFFSYSLGFFKLDSSVTKLLKCVILAFTISVVISQVDVTKLFGRDNSLGDPSSFANQINVIDKVYERAGGKNFKAYVHIPSVYDYQYQYLFWWWGYRKYGYLPVEYAYAPNKPEYISSKANFSGKSNREESGLIFLIKEKSDSRLEDLWLNTFVENKLVVKMMVGALELEIRNENVKKN